MINLGQTYKDAVTGFEGMAVGKVAYISGCSQVLLAPKVDRDGKLLDSQWFDEQRCRAVSEEVLVLDNGSTPGFDKQAPKR